MKRLVAGTLVLAIVGMAGLACQRQAVSTASTADGKPNPSGTWKWSVTFGQQAREMTLKLKLDGDKLTGSMPGRNGSESPIQDATYKDGEVSFKVVRERRGSKTTTTYTGTVSGDTIKGKAESQRDGKPQSRDWEAKRAAD
jgi:hypothetical protein